MVPTPTLEEVLALVHRLPPAEQATLLARLSTEIAALLRPPLAPTPARSSRSLRGLWADQNISISSDDIDKARREMWGNFPRDDI